MQRSDPTFVRELKQNLTASLIVMSRLLFRFTLLWGWGFWEGLGFSPMPPFLGPFSSFEVFVRSTVLFHFMFKFYVAGVLVRLGGPLDKLASKRAPLCRSVLSVGSPWVQNSFCTRTLCFALSSHAFFAPRPTPEFQCGVRWGPFKH